MTDFSKASWCIKFGPLPVRLFLIFLLIGPAGQAFSQGAGKSYHPKPFIHPGISQQRADLDLMKKRVLAGEQPWKGAFDRILKSARLDFDPKPFTHVIRGSYGSPAIGGSELSSGAGQAYNLSILWYVTGERKYADKAIEIINAWSARLWDFDDNDAKLLAGWTGHVFCNAAEILKYSNSGWQQKDITQFKHMLLSAYYPLITGFFPEANGNWDAAIMDTMLGIAIFCDDHVMFDKVIDHYLFGEGNSGITKYVYPNGQCQESTRDQSHTQLGLGELAQTCQIAWTQGVDLYGAAQNRLALGFEYTSRYMLGKDVDAYGEISSKGRKGFNDIYESVYRHYHDVKGLEMPYTKLAADTNRNRAGLSLLTSVRAPLPGAVNLAGNTPLVPVKIAERAGANVLTGTVPAVPGKVFRVGPEGSIQAALDSCAASGGSVLLEKGVYTVQTSLKITSGITLAGQGKETVLFVDPKINPDKTGTAIINQGPEMSDVTIRDLVIEGAMTPQPSSDPNQDRRQRSYQMAQPRAGIVFMGLYEGQMKNIRMERITVRNCTKNGVAITGATGVTISRCDFSDNGSSVVPGNGIHHNLLIAHVREASITGSRMDTSPWGNGVSVTESSKITLTGNEFARNRLNGLYVADSREVVADGNLIEGNDGDGIGFDVHTVASSGGSLQNNRAWYNGKRGINPSGIKGVLMKGNMISSNAMTQ